MMFFALRKMMLLVLLAMMRCLQITLGEADIISEGNIISVSVIICCQANIIQKSHLCLGRQKWLFCWWAIKDSNLGPSGYEPDALTNWANGPNLAKSLSKERLFTILVTRGGIEPPLPPWKGGVLTAWPTGHYGSGSWTWTHDLSGMNRLL